MIRTRKHLVPFFIVVMKAECVHCEVGIEILNITNIVMSSTLQSVHELIILDLVNIVENRNAVRWLE